METGSFLVQVTRRAALLAGTQCRTLSIGIVVSLGSTVSAADEVSFEKTVAPIFRRHCVRCHRGKEPKDGLDLTRRKGLLAGGESGAAVVSGKPDDSLLMDFVTGDEPEIPKPVFYS